MRLDRRRARRDTAYPLDGEPTGVHPKALRRRHRRAIDSHMVADPAVGVAPPAKAQIADEPVDARHLLGRGGHDVTLEQERKPWRF